MTHYKHNGVVVCGMLTTREETDDPRLCDCFICRDIIKRMHLSVFIPAHDEIEYPEESGFIFSVEETKQESEAVK